MFTDEDKINSINKLTLPEVEVLYWKTEDSLSEGDLKSATLYFEMLCYIAQHRKHLITQGLRKPQKERLAAIPYLLKGLNVPSSVSPIIDKRGYPPVHIPFKKEKEIGDFIYKNSDILTKALKKKGRITGREVEIGGYKCDLVYENPQTLFAIELKKTQADHKIVSQLDKYCHYFYRKQRYNFFKNVQGVSIANGYDQWAINELRRHKHWIFWIKYEKEISLERII